MAIGLILNGSSARQDVDLACRAEAAGFDSVFTVDFFNRSALARLAYVAARTERVRVGTAIANAFTRSPMVLAAAALDLDELSGGRLVLGLGTGLKRMNQEWFGVPFSRPASRARELIELLRVVFRTRGPGFSFEGEHWQLKIPAYQRAQITRSAIPILLAGVNTGMIEAAGRTADGLVGHPVHSRRWHREITLPTLRQAEAGARRNGGSCRLYPYVITSIQKNVDHARRDAKRQIGFSFSVEHYHSILKLHGLEAVGHECRRHLPSYDLEAMADAIPETLVDEIAVACTPDEAAHRLEQWRELTDEPLLYPAAIGTPGERLAANLDHIFEVWKR